MRLTFFISFLVCLFSFNAQAKQADTLTIVSYNIHHGNPPTAAGIIDLDAIAKVLAAQNADFIALQEVDVNVQRSGKVDQAAYLAKALGMHYFFAKAIDYGGGDYGVAVLSKHPILASKVLKFAPIVGLKAEDRAAAIVTAKLASGKQITFSAVHLDHKADAKLRLQQLGELLSYSKTIKTPFIVAGDFNAGPNSETIQQLDKAFSRTCIACAPTFPVVTPNITIDYIAFKKTKKLAVISHQVIAEHYASDHLPIAAKLHYR